MDYRVLIIDDDVDMTRLLGCILQSEGYAIREVNRATEALDAALQFRPHAIILDFQMPELHGADVAWQFACDPLLASVPLLMCTGAVEELAKVALPPRTIPVFQKPVPIPAILEWLRQLSMVPAERGLI